LNYGYAAKLAAFFFCLNVRIIKFLLNVKDKMHYTIGNEGFTSNLEKEKV
jgi:hypothetical protein